jgi:alpha-glucosidase
LLAYRRQKGEARFLVVLNFSREAAVFTATGVPRGTVALSTHLDREGEAVDGRIELRGDEGAVVRLED